jgi:hypothetical protein
MEGTAPMKWNLRLTAANRGIWKASELQPCVPQLGWASSTRIVVLTCGNAA